MTICNTSPASLDAARDLCEQAAALLKNEVQDHIWEDLQTLKTKVVRRGSSIRHYTRGRRAWWANGPSSN